MADNLYGQSFNFPQLFPGAADNNPPPLPSMSLPDNSDFSARYRAQAELVRRTGDPVPGGNGIPPGLYADPRSSWMSWPQDPSEQTYTGPGSQDMNHNGIAGRYLPSLSLDPKHHQQQLPSDKDLQAALARNYLENNPNHNNNSSGFAIPGVGNDPFSISYAHDRDRHRRGSIGMSSDGSSVPSSAASSNVHLPLDIHQQMAYHVRVKFIYIYTLNSLLSRVPSQK